MNRRGFFKALAAGAAVYAGRHLPLPPEPIAAPVPSPALTDLIVQVFHRRKAEMAANIMARNLLMGSLCPR